MENNNYVSNNSNKQSKILGFFKNFTYKKALFILVIILSAISIVLTLYPLAFNTFLNYNTDDVIQYYSYAISFYNKVKDGSLSIFDQGLWGGASFFSNVYYLPLDLFFIFGLLLSYIMPSEFSYFFTNILRVLAGSVILFIFLKRKNIRPLVCLLTGLIFFMGGMTETEFVFPVYLGISFYAPLALLIVDLVIEKKNVYYLLIPLYTFVVVIYDYYIAYMLIALMCVYFVIAYHLYSKKFFLATGEFYLRLLELLLLIALGLLISAFIMAPSLAYVLNESSRTDDTFDPSFIYFSKSEGNSVKISIRHYFTGFTTFFMPNNPFNLALVGPGDYVREHYSFYLTSGGLIYLIYFFFTKGKENNRLKFWTLLINLMFLMPIFSMIFTVSKLAYTRWFFIPYMINIYAMARGMNQMGMKVGKYNFVKIFPFIILVISLYTSIFILINNPDIFIHYKAGEDEYFYPIVIGSLIFIGIYLLILLILFLVQLFGKRRLIDIFTKILITTIFGELIFAMIINFSNVGSTDYLYKHYKIDSEYYPIYDLGYKYTDGYRINLNTNSAKSTTNTNVIHNMTNPTSFFQSFYNKNLNTYSRDMHSDYSDFWSRGSIYGYSLINGPMWNMKYIVDEKDFEGIYLPEKYYKTLDTKDDLTYYEVKDSFNFIVYDSIFDSSAYDSFYNDLALLSSGYVRKATSESDEKEKLTYDKIVKTNIEIKNIDEIRKDINNTYNIKSKTVSNPKSDTDGYFIYDIKDKYDEIFDFDSYYVMPSDSAITTLENPHMYLKTVDGDNEYFYPLHYNVGYKNNNIKGKITELWIQYKESNNSSFARIYGYNLNIYDDFINKQNEYKNRKFEINDNKIHIEFTNNDDKVKIIKTGYAYSDDWKASDGYETCNINGGFLGIIVKENTKDININLEFKPKYYEVGLKLTALGCIIYLSMSIGLLGFIILKNKKVIK